MGTTAIHSTWSVRCDTPSGGSCGDDVTYAVAVEEGDGANTVTIAIWFACPFHLHDAVDAALDHGTNDCDAWGEVDAHRTRYEPRVSVARRESFE